jgi:UDP-GlcNAc3NAcA epimerase
VRVLTVVGNRPQFIKAAAVSPLLRAAPGCAERLVHTGQHHDESLSAVFFAELGLPAPDVALGIAGGSNTSQTARMLAALEPLLHEPPRPDWVLVYGDTNSTLAGALAAAQAGLPVAHVEAGMRSFDRSMPEELNRVLTDHLSALLLCSSDSAARWLRAEGVSGEVEVVGDVMLDVALAAQARAREWWAGSAQRRPDPQGLGRAERRTGPSRELEPGSYLLATAHRAANVDRPERLGALVDVLLAAAGSEAGAEIVLPLHPRTRARLLEAGLLDRLAAAGSGVSVLEPVGYLEMTRLLVGARAVLTDSGGLQKEAYLAGVPCVTLRERTEWVETVQAGWNVLAGLDPGAVLRALRGFAEALPAQRPALYGDGRAGRRVVEALRLAARHP